jgi:hypothetical protein
MNKSVLLLALVSIVSALVVGCAPNADRGPISFVPRDYQFVPQISPTSSPVQQH